MPVFHIRKTPERKADQRQKEEDSEYFEEFFHLIKIVSFLWYQMELA
jgi:hypothetical protein